MVHALLSGGAKVDLLARGDSSPLHTACHSGHTEVVRTLLSAGAKVNLQNKDGVSPLCVACQDGHTGLVRDMLAAGAKIDLQTKDGKSPLYVACQEGRTKVVHTLLSRGARVDLLACGAESALHVACCKGHMEVVCALLSAGAEVDQQEAWFGNSLLHMACLFGQTGVARALLSAGAVADMRDKSDKTPLDRLPRALRAEVERLVPQAKEERGSARADECKAGAPSSGPAAVLPTPHYHLAASQLQAASVDGAEGSSEASGGLSAEASSISGRALSGRVCSMCGGPPSASASSGGVAKLRACGRCRSVRYCSQECQKNHWEEGGHKEACPQLREKREEMKVSSAGDLVAE